MENLYPRCSVTVLKGACPGPLFLFRRAPVNKRNINMDGIISLLKPPGMTSSNAVFDIRKLSGEKRAGHLGTLDPGAAGVLPVCLGRATQLFDLLVDKEKTYRFTCLFGSATDTQDGYGKVIAQAQMAVTEQALNEALPRFTGSVLQQAPAYSALKSNGRKLYDLALAGEEIPEKIRPVVIHRLSVLRQIAENAFLMEITCSRGTYVRTVCHDLGLALGGFAHMGLLIRTAAGPFTAENSYTMEELRALSEADRLGEAVGSVENALMFLPALRLREDRYKPVKNGLYSSAPRAAEGLCRLYCGSVFMGVGTVEKGEAKLKVHLYDN